MRSNTILAILFFAVWAVSSNAQTNSPSSPTGQQAADTPVKIKNKPQAQFSRGECSRSGGRARLRATFDRSGKVTNAEVVVSSGCPSFDRNAIKAARGIKFEPAVKKGEPVTVTKLLEYSFNVY